MNKRLAFIIGNSAYGTNPLANPVNDAKSMTSALTGFGFDTVTLTDCSFSEFNDGLDQFEKMLNDYEVGLVFFAGHGIQIDGLNYLIMVDTDASTERRAKGSSANLDEILGVMSKSGIAASIVLLDACRNNPWARSWTREIDPRGLAPVFAPKGTIIGYATSPGELASDGAGANGTYTAALLNHMGEKDRPIEVIFKRVRNQVAADTSGKQTTWEHTSLSGDFFFDISLATALGGYSAEAYADRKFRASSPFAEETINALKTYSWYTQNPAINALSAAVVRELSQEEMFVIGRNILQAADGSSGSATNFITEFSQQTRGWPEAKKLACFDGILFEIYFDSNGEPRSRIKWRVLDEVMENRNQPSLSASFNFITDSLTQAGKRMFAMPNQAHQIGVIVKINGSEDVDVVDSVWVDGRNVMTINDERVSSRRRTNAWSDKDRFEWHISELMCLPIDQLEIIYQPKLSEDELRYPLGMELTP